MKNRFTKQLDEKFTEARQGRITFLTVFGEPESEEQKDLTDQMKDMAHEDFTILEDKSPHAVRPPYDPFLSFIAEKTTHMSAREIDSLLEEMSFYTPHKILISSFLTGKPSHRKERILQDEFNYDNQVLMEAIWLLFKHLYRGEKVLIIIDKADFLPISTCRWLSEIAEKDDGFPLFTALFVSNAMTSFQKSEEREKALTSLRVTGGLIRLIYKKRTPKISTRQFPSLEETLYLVKTNIEYLAHEDTLEILDEMESRPGFRIEELSENNKILMYTSRIKACYYSGDYHNALHQASVNLKYAVAANNNSMIAEAYWSMAIIHFAMQSPSKALDALKKSMSLSEEIHDDKLSYYNIYLLLLIDTKERILDVELWQKHYFEFIRLGKNLGNSSTLACWLARPERLNYATEIEMIDKLQEEAIALCTKSGNLFRLAAAYHARASAFMFREDYPSVQFYYEKCADLKEQLGNVIEIAYTNNGIGRYHYETGEFIKADEYYQKAINAARQVGDYRETAMSMCNIGLNYLYSFDFHRSLLYLSNLYDLMIMLKMGDLSYHSLFHIKTLLASAHLKCGNSAKAKDLIRDLKIEVQEREKLLTMPFATLSEELLDYYLLISLYYSTVGKREKARKAIDHCITYYRNNIAVHNYFSPVFHYEIGAAYLLLNRPDEANQFFKRGLVSIGEGLHYHFGKILKRKIEDNSFCPVIFEDNSYTVNFEMLKISAQNSLSLNFLQQKVDDIHFLNSAQELLARDPGKEEFLNGSMDILSFYFRADCIALIRQKGRAKGIVYNRSGFGEEELLSFFKSVEQISRPDNAVILNTEQMEAYFPDTELKSLIGIPVQGVNYYLICGTTDSDNPLNREDYQLLSLFTGILRSGIERAEYIRSIEKINSDLQKANRKLELSATTDPLTGLFNRKALMEKLEEEKKRFCRYHKNDGRFFSLLFIDLDNFKYCNDNFGHDVGDLILKHFAAILKKVCRVSDFISRYGGDEFIILLPESSEEGAVKQANRILEEIEAASHFQPDLEEHLQKKVKIPPAKRISCSIGITYCSDCKNISIEDFIRRADKAVYAAKRSGKGRVEVYKDNTS